MYLPETGINQANDAAGLVRAPQNGVLSYGEALLSLVAEFNLFSNWSALFPERTAH